MYEVFIVDKFGNLRDSISNINRKKIRNNFIGYVYTYKFKSNIMFIGSYRSNLYKLTTHKKKEKYAVFNLGNEISCDELIIEPKMGNKMDNILNIVKILETTDYLFITVAEGIRGAGKEPLKHQILYNKISNKVFNTDEFINDVNNGPSFWPSFVLNEKLIGYYLPYQLIKYKNENETANQFSFGELNDISIKTISENDNPIIAIVEQLRN